MAGTRRRHTNARRISHSGWFEKRAGGVIQPITESGGTHPERPALDWAEARAGEQSQQFDIAPGAVDGAVHILPGSLDIDLFAEGIIAPEVVAALPTLPDASYPIGFLVFLTTDQKLYRNPDDVAWTTAVDGADIIADSITAGSIAAGAIGADQLASEIILGGLVIAGDPDAAHLELDSDGLRVFDASLNLLINAPTDGSEVYINAAVEALSLTVPGDAVFQGDDNQFAISSVTQLMAQQQPPSQAPTLSQGWATLTLPVNATYDRSSTKYSRQGLAYSASGGAGGATKVFYQVAEKSTLEMQIVELLASDRTVNRVKALGDDALAYYAPSLVRHGNWIYLYYADFSLGHHVQRYLNSDLSLVDSYHSVSLPGDAARPQDHHITSDGTNVYIVGPDEFGVLKWNKYNDTMVKQGSTVSTGDAPDGSGTRAVGAFAGSADFGAFRMCVLTEFDSIYVYDSTGTEKTNEEFDTAGPASSPGPQRGLTYGDVFGDGARFISMGAISFVTAQTLTKHSTWIWTTASSKYWVGYAWYDSAGTTHETTVSSRASITMGRRKQLTVTMQALPGAGGADDPNSRRVYMVPKSTTPATTELDLQATVTTTSALLTTYDSGGAAPSTTNTFPSGTPGQLKSATAGWSLKGDGEAWFNTLWIGSALDVGFVREGANLIALQGGADGLRIRNSTDLTLTSDDHPLTIGNQGGNNVAFDNNEIQARDNGAAAQLFINKDGGAVNISASGDRTTVEGGLTIGGAGVANNGTLILSDGAIRLNEVASAPSVGGANTVIIYADDNGSGKTRLRARFNTGTIQTLATEP